MVRQFFHVLFFYMCSSKSGWILQKIRESDWRIQAHTFRKSFKSVQLVKVFGMAQQQSFLCLTLGCAFQQRQNLLGRACEGPGVSQPWSTRQGRIGNGLGFSLEHGNVAVIFKSFCRSFSEPGPWVAATTSQGPSWPKSQCFCVNAVVMPHQQESSLNFCSGRKGTCLDSCGFCSGQHHQGISQAKWFSLPYYCLVIV